MNSRLKQVLVLVASSTSLMPPSALLLVARTCRDANDTFGQDYYFKAWVRDTVAARTASGRGAGAANPVDDIQCESRQLVAFALGLEQALRNQPATEGREEQFFWETILGMQERAPWRELALSLVQNEAGPVLFWGDDPLSECLIVHQEPNLYYIDSALVGCGLMKKEVVVQESHLRHVSSRIGLWSDLQALTLEDHFHPDCFSTIPATIGFLVNLTNLHLHQNQLTHLPETLDRLVNLEYLD
ncbi:hypothetical protein HDU91_003346, partial [Kappamyces sp. JEL0680]